MQFPKGSGGSEKKIFFEHILLGQISATLPLSVEHVLRLAEGEGLDSLNSRLEGEVLNPLKSGEIYILPLSISDKA